MVTTNNGLNRSGYVWGKNYSLDQISDMPVPEATMSYQPVRQTLLFNNWSSAMQAAGYSITSEEHWATNNRDVFLSKITISAPWLPSGLGFRWQAALINSYNRQVAIKTAMGAEVFVCTNGCLSAEYLMKTKHTSNVFNRIDDFVSMSVRTVDFRAKAIYNQFMVYTQTDAGSDKQVDHVVCEAYRKGIIPASGIGQVLDHWRNPEHAEFKPRNVWSLYNAFTSYDRGRSVFERSHRTNRLHSILNREFALGGETPQEATNSLS
jgi:hypothetical protein